MKHSLRSRRSNRTYKDKPVPREEIARLITVASHSPWGDNTQSPRWRVIDNSAQIQKLAAIVIDWMGWMVENQPEIGADLHMARAIRRWGNGTDVILRGAPAVVVAHAEKTDRTAPAACTIALATMELAALSMGRGTYWAGYFRGMVVEFSAYGERTCPSRGSPVFRCFDAGIPPVCLPTDASE